MTTPKKVLGLIYSSGFTLCTLADAVGCDKGWLSRLLQGKCPAKTAPAWLEEIARKLRVSRDELERLIHEKAA